MNDYLTLKPEMLLNACHYDGLCRFVEEYHEEKGFGFCYGNCKAHDKCPFKNIDMDRDVILIFKNMENKKDG